MKATYTHVRLYARKAADLIFRQRTTELEKIRDWLAGYDYRFTAEALGMVKVAIGEVRYVKSGQNWSTNAVGFPLPGGGWHVCDPTKPHSSRWRFTDGGKIDLLVVERDPTAPIVIFEGEWDLLAALSLGIPNAATGTGGAETFKPEWAARFGGRDCVICYDVDPSGRKGSQQRVAPVVAKAAKRVRIVSLPLDGTTMQKDLRDWVRGGGTLAAWNSLVEAVPAFAVFADSPNGGSLTGPVLVPLTDVGPKPISWLWPGRIPLGKLTLIVGDPGLGKSFLLVDMAARVSAKAPWPNGGTAPEGKVLLLTAEDGLADTVRPRLDAMGGNSASVVALTGVRRKGTDETGITEAGLSLARDVQELEAAIVETGAIMVGIDPLSAYLGKTDSYKDAEVRGLLAPLAALAERRNVAVVGIMHLSKDVQRRALYRAQGSLAFVAAARAVFVVTPEQDNPARRLFLPLKLNVAVKPPGLAFSIPYDPTGPSRLVWADDPVDINVEDALGDSQSPGEQEERESAANFLQDLLADGEILSKDIFRLARENGFSEKAIRKARPVLGINPRKDGFGKDGRWYWGLPKVPTKMTSPRDEGILAESQCVSVDRERVSPKMSTAQDEDILGGHVSGQMAIWEEEF